MTTKRFAAASGQFIHPVCDASVIAGTYMYKCTHAVTTCSIASCVCRNISAKLGNVFVSEIVSRFLQCRLRGCF